VLVIAPASVLDHWRRELKKWADVPDEKIIIIDASGKEAAAKRAEQVANVPEGGWCLVNWEKLQKRVKLAGESAKKKGPLDKVKWYGVIADEAHRAKNHDSQQSKALQRLRAPVQIAATGTPVMNNPGELYALLAWLRPEQYTSYWAFYYSYTEFYKGYQGRDVIIGVKNADDLRFELSDKMVRRTKREIHPDIPEPLDPIIYEPPMSAKQAKIYAEAEKDFWFEIAQAPDISKEQKLAMVEALEDENVSVETVKMMIPNAAARTMRLRQVATSPAILGGEDVSSKLDEAEQIVLSNGIDQPFVWFAWFKDTVDLLVHRFRELGADAHGFHGGNSSREDRAKLAAEFQAGEFSIICATIKTGGTGIDLYRAADCGFIEEDWVPGENQQAFDRIDRKGQGFHPQRHILRAPDTVDVGKIAPKLATKTLIVETITGGMK
jgi:SNF2 family DNA or RNA helicase